MKAAAFVIPGGLATHRQAFAAWQRLHAENEKRRAFLADPRRMASRAAEVGLQPADLATLLGTNLQAAEPEERILARWLTSSEAAALKAEEARKASAISFKPIEDIETAHARDAMERLEAELMAEGSTQVSDAPGEVLEADFEDTDLPSP